MDINEINNFKGLINSLNLVLQRARTEEVESRSRGEKFNIFSVCGVNHYETSHSAIIAEFLNPNGSHGQQDIYLRLFLEMLEKKGMKMTFSDEHNVEVLTEYQTCNGRIDILIKGINKVIIIENKIYAAEQEEQLSRYRSWADNYYKDNNTVVYLTLDGKESETIRDKEYIRISYEDDIVKWLQNCARESVYRPLIRETINQYVNHINMLTNHNMDKKNSSEFLNLMLENYEVVSEVFKKQRDFVEQSIAGFFLPELEKIATIKGLEMSGKDDFMSGISGRDIIFRESNWKNFEIHLGQDANNWSQLYVGVVRRNNEAPQIDKLKCMKKSNEMWCGGWVDLKINKIDAETIPDIRSMSGDSKLASEIKGIIESILNEVDQQKLPF